MFFKRDCHAICLHESQGRDARDQTEAKKCEKTRFRKADREVLNPSLIGGKACRKQATTEDAAMKQERVAKARRKPDCMAGRDFREQNDAKKSLSSATLS